MSNMQSWSVAGATPYIKASGAGTDADPFIPVHSVDGTTALTVTVPVQVTKTVAATATPEALAADGTFFQAATLIGKKAARTLNTGTVYLGIGATNDTQALEILPGEVIEITAPPGQKYDLNDWYLDVATAADGVVIIYS